MFKIRFKTVEYISDSLPICNICSSKIVLTNHLESCMKDKPYYKIIKCSNDNCKSNTQKMSLYEPYETFLPKDVADKKISELKNSFKKNNRYSIKSWVNKGYTEDEAKIKISELQKTNAKLVKPKNRVKLTKEYYKQKGFTDDEIRMKTLTPSKIEFWTLKGYTEEGAKLQIEANQAYANSKVIQSNILNNTQLEYWIKKCDGDVEKAKILRKKRQRTFNKDICIEKYGKVEGLKRWKERQNKWQKSLSDNGNMKSGYSKVSQSLFEDIRKYYNDDVNIFYATFKGEKVIRFNYNNYQFDFVDESSKKIIEYQGDQYHANPRKYDADDYPHPYRNGKGDKSHDIWHEDMKKKEVAECFGYELLYIWDSDFKKNKIEVLDKCLNFLNLN